MKNVIFYVPMTTETDMDDEKVKDYLDVRNK